MATDEHGNLKPLMLSELAKIATDTLKEHGDMPVGLETCVVGNEVNEYHSFPVSDAPTVGHPRWIRSYWIGQFTKAFVIDGA